MVLHKTTTLFNVETVSVNIKDTFKQIIYFQAYTNI